MINKILNNLEKQLEEVQKGARERILSKEDIIDTVSQAEFITKKLKGCGLEFEYIYQSGDKCGGYAYVGTCFKANFNKNGECNKIEISRDKHSWNIDTLEYKKEDGSKFTKLEEKLLRECFGADTGHNRINIR
ncbi:hypothetical protein [Clostridium sp. C2-6-12]|uniref:hypothetical protein n=1 Tax=Clostridium sp. C2-6-12 TaxID=2698832 RepID=UPI00136FE944|nr:hypothetical protein [Clostridium sp. C2-6-12]